MADKAGVQFMEVSAKTGQNTEEALNILSKSMLAKVRVLTYFALG